MKKTFDAVSFQRKARAELSRAYLANREAFLEELKNKYGKLRKSRSWPTTRTRSAKKGLGSHLHGLLPKPN
jgi:hypothetical protein